MRRIRRRAAAGVARPGAARCCRSAHDRASRTGRLRSYPGGWADYMRVRDERRYAAEAADSAPRPAAQGRPARGPGGTGPRSRRTRSDASRPSSVQSKRRNRRSPASRTSSPTPECWTTPERSAESTARHVEAKRSGRATLRGAFDLRRLTDRAMLVGHLASPAGEAPCLHRRRPVLSFLLPRRFSHRGGEEGTFRVSGSAGPHRQRCCRHIECRCQAAERVHRQRTHKGKDRDQP